jgi:hypothetical protein
MAMALELTSRRLPRWEVHQKNISNLDVSSNVIFLLLKNELKTFFSVAKQKALPSTMSIFARNESISKNSDDKCCALNLRISETGYL